MQILPLTLALLLIFSISTQAILNKALVSKNIQSQYHGYFTASRKVLNEKESLFFKKAPKEKKKDDDGKNNASHILIETNDKKGSLPPSQDKEEKEKTKHFYIAPVLGLLIFHIFLY